MGERKDRHLHIVSRNQGAGPLRRGPLIITRGVPFRFNPDLTNENRERIQLDDEANDGAHDCGFVADRIKFKEHGTPLAGRIDVIRTETLHEVLSGGKPTVFLNDSEPFVFEVFLRGISELESLRGSVRFGLLYRQRVFEADLVEENDDSPGKYDKYSYSWSELPQKKKAGLIIPKSDLTLVEFVIPKASESLIDYLGYNPTLPAS